MVIDMAYESYSAYLTISKLHTDPVQHYKDTLQDIIDDRFDVASDYETVSLLNRETLVGTSIGVRLAKIRGLTIEPAIRDDYFQVLFKNFDTEINLGDLFEFDDYRWLVIDISKQSSETMSCIIQRCNAKLKFVYSNNDVLPTITDDVISIDCIAEKKIYDVQKDKYYSYGDEEIGVKVANNSNSRKIKADTKRGTRFLIGNPADSYYVKGLDSISMVRTDINDSNVNNGIINLKLQLEQMNTRTDNVAEMVAKQYCYGGV